MQNWITCQICKAQVAFIESHLTKEHAEWTLEKYATEYPEAPVMSERAEHLLAEKSKQWATNGKVNYNVKNLFNVTPYGSVSDVWGWSKPTDRVPAQVPYFFRRDLLASVLCAFESKNEFILLTGPTGSGKTSVFEQVAARLNRPVIRVNLDGDITRSDLVGQWVLNGENSMEFHYGPLATAMMEGYIFIVDEIDAGASPVTMALQAVLEGKPLSLMETNEVIKPHPDFRLMATANTNGMGDESGLYAGTQVQNYASFDRFTLVEKVDYPKPEEETEIIVSQTGMKDSPDIVAKLIKVANLIREAHKTGDTVCTMSTRNVVNIARKLSLFGDIRQAYKVAYLNRLSDNDLDFCNEIIQKNWA